MGGMGITTKRSVKPIYPQRFPDIPRPLLWREQALFPEGTDFISRMADESQSFWQAGRLADQLLADWQANFWQMGWQAGSEYNSISRPVGKCSYKCSLVLLQLIRSSCYRLKSFSHPSTLGYSELVLQFRIVTNTHLSEGLLVCFHILYNYILGTLQIKQTVFSNIQDYCYKIFMKVSVTHCCSPMSICSAGCLLQAKFTSLDT